MLEAKEAAVAEMEQRHARELEALRGEAKEMEEQATRQRAEKDSLSQELYRAKLQLEEVERLHAEHVVREQLGKAELAAVETRLRERLALVEALELQRQSSVLNAEAKLTELKAAETRAAAARMEQQAAE